MTPSFTTRTLHALLSKLRLHFSNFCLVCIAAFLFPPHPLAAQSLRLYTQENPDDKGGITGRAGAPLAYAFAMERDLTRVYRAKLDGVEGVFHFANLPVGKYDLVLVTKDGTIYEGLELGESEMRKGARAGALEERIVASDTFFNRVHVHRQGWNGEVALVFVERIRDGETVRHSGEDLNQAVQRLEVIALEPATDDWQLTDSRHILRETHALEKGMPFLKSVYVSSLNDHRVIDSIKDLGVLSLPSPSSTSR